MLLQYQIHKAVNLAIDTNNISELDRLFKLVKNKYIQRKIFYAIVEIHENGV
jgi:hypothetical protein